MTIEKKRKNKGKELVKKKVKKVKTEEEDDDNEEIEESIEEETNFEKQAEKINENEENKNNEGEEKNFGTENYNDVEENLETLLLFLNNEEPTEVLKGIKILRKSCNHAQKLKKKLERVANKLNKIERKDFKDIEKESLLFEYLTSSPECIELFTLWTKYKKLHNYKLTAAVIEVLANILDANFFPSCTSTSAAIRKIVLRDKMKWIYGAFGSSGPQSSLYFCLLKKFSFLFLFYYFID